MGLSPAWSVMVDALKILVAIGLTIRMGWFFCARDRGNRCRSDDRLAHHGGKPNWWGWRLLLWAVLQL